MVFSISVEWFWTNDVFKKAFFRHASCVSSEGFAFAIVSGALVLGATSSHGIVDNISLSN